MKKILILDDDKEWAGDIKEYFESKDYCVDYESDPNKCLQMIRSNFYEILIIDYKLLDGFSDFDTGLKVINEIRKFDKLVPIILISGQIEKAPSVEEIFEQAIHLGILDYFKKGPGASALLEIVRKNGIRQDDIFRAFVKWFTEAEDKDKEIIISSTGEKYTPEKIISEIREGTEFGKRIKEKLAEFSLEALN